MKNTIKKKCEWCGNEFETENNSHGRKKRFCNTSCSAKWRINTYGVAEKTDAGRKKLSEQMKKNWETTTLRENNKKRMTENNPMSSQKTIEKMLATRKNNGSYSNNFNNCGNGHISYAEKIAGSVLFEFGFEYNKVFCTKTLRDLYPEENYPKNYKPDFFNGSIIIEIDGESHNRPRQKEIDAKKERFFEHLGIKTFRYSNDFVLNHTEKFRMEVSMLCALYQKNI